MSLVSAIDTLLAFVKDRDEIPRSEMPRFYELDQRVFALAFKHGLHSAVPKQHEVERPQTHPSQLDLPPIVFEGKTSLPGDWLPAPGGFVPISEGHWEQDMLALRALAADQMK